MHRYLIILLEATFLAALWGLIDATNLPHRHWPRFSSEGDYPASWAKSAPAHPLPHVHQVDYKAQERALGSSAAAVASGERARRVKGSGTALVAVLCWPTPGCYATCQLLLNMCWIKEVDRQSIWNIKHYEGLFFLANLPLFLVFLWEVPMLACLGRCWKMRGRCDSSSWDGLGLHLLLSHGRTDLKRR